MTKKTVSDINNTENNRSPSPTYILKAFNDN